MQSAIWLITRVVVAVGLMSVASLVFLGQGSMLIRQGSLESPNGMASVVLAGPLAGNANDNGSSSSSSDNISTTSSAPATATPTRTPGTTGAAAPPPPPPPPASQGECQFVRGFADFHRTLSGRDGTCKSNEFPDPNGTGDTLQLTSLPVPNGLMVWRKLTNSMAWTDGNETWAYSKCLLQVRKNTEVFAWELNPNLLIPESAPVPPGACDTLPRLAVEPVDSGHSSTGETYLPSPG